MFNYDEEDTVEFIYYYTNLHEDVYEEQNISLLWWNKHTVIKRAVQLLKNVVIPRMRTEDMTGVRILWTPGIVVAPCRKPNRAMRVITLTPIIMLIPDKTLTPPVERVCVFWSGLRHCDVTEPAAVVRRWQRGGLSLNSELRCSTSWLLHIFHCAPYCM